MSKVRHYCATFFKEPSVKLPEGVRYAIYGEEIAPTTGRTHWQAYMELEKPMRMAAIKKLYDDNTIHLEVRKGTRDEAKTYCMKENKYTEHGKWIKGQGHRSDLDDIVAKLVDGTKLSELMLEHPKTYCQYRNGLKDIAASVVKKTTSQFRQLDVKLICGPTGVGKTRSAVENAGPDAYMIHGTKLNWWQDYDGEETIIIDEYSNDINITELLGILDGYQLRLNVKGSHTYANWRSVYITTNLKPEEIHQQAKPAHRAALFRRITSIENHWDKEAQG